MLESEKGPDMVWGNRRMLSFISMKQWPKIREQRFRNKEHNML